jgi:hypothetical protein
LELVNDAPLDPVMIGEEIDALRAQVAPDLFSGFDRRRFPASSLPGLMLTATAYQHSLPAGERVSLALRHALFEDGLDIADGGVPMAGCASRLTSTPSTRSWSAAVNRERADRSSPPGADVARETPPPSRRTATPSSRPTCGTRRTPHRRCRRWRWRN